VALTIHPNPAAKLKKEYIYTSFLPLSAYMACFVVNFTINDTTERKI